MVKYSGKVILQTGGRGKSVLPGNRSSRPTCVVTKKIYKKSGINKKKSIDKCRNKIFGLSPMGNLCKKHFEIKVNNVKDKDKKLNFKVYSNAELEKFYPKKNEKNINKTFKQVCTNCKNTAFKDRLCKKHYRNRFFEK